MIAIQTMFDGYRFRSRLEARWAVFFDTLKITWQYEPEGFELKTRRYLPDFYLSDIDTYFEIKPPIEPPVSVQCLEKWHDYDTPLDEFEEIVQKRIVLLCGEPYIDFDRELRYYTGFIAGDAPYLFCECSQCGRIGIQFDGRSERINCRCCDQNRVERYGYDSPRLRQAYRAARAARFEHGENGRSRP